MKRIAIVLGLGVTLLAAGIAAATSPTLPAGKFTGTAAWRGGAGSAGTYTVERTFDGNKMSARFAWSEPKPREEKVAMTLAMKGSEPFFDVLDEKDKVVGKGYCYDEACSYHASYGPVSVDETLRWSEGSLEVLGSKSGPGFSVVWKETLTSR